MHRHSLSDPSAGTSLENERGNVGKAALLATMNFFLMKLKVT